MCFRSPYNQKHTDTIIFLNNDKHKNLAFPAGEGADQLLRREADEGYASTASSVRQQTAKQQFEVIVTNRGIL